MKLVVCYTVGDGCTYHCDVVKCFEYESAEAFICDFETTLRSAIRYCTEQNELLNNWQASRPDDKAKHSAWYASRPDIHSYKINRFEFCGQEFDIDEFLSHDFDRPKITADVVLPDVYELDEWFEKTKNNLI